MNDASLHSKRRSRRRLAVLVLLLVTAGCSAVYWWAFLMREHQCWTETVNLWNGQRLQIQQHSSQKAYHGDVGHFSPFWWGGGDPRHETRFTIEGREYRWEGPYIPFAVQPDGSDAYIAVFDRETPGGSRFRLYRSIALTQWAEISPREFPKHLAIQNTWLRKNNGIRMDHTVVNEYDIVAEMDPAPYDFRRSFTAKLWMYLENPQYQYSSGDMCEEKFVGEYKAKWIRAARQQSVPPATPMQRTP